eukprot:TRINITY_DN8579_c0_g2_i1.p1 TRINITY_DN8579_c0_g2~~TRINITY_DN8579_c0_g2_i1.p1  ORF type:complete len:213 (+),score=22.47 TRINITY_DN8579_c0_g2_i1:257-895(+)
MRRTFSRILSHTPRSLTPKTTTSISPHLYSSTTLATKKYFSSDSHSHHSNAPHTTSNVNLNSKSINAIRGLKTNEEWISYLKQRATIGLPAHMKFEVVSIDEHCITSKLVVEPFHMAPNGYCHAASIILLADTTTGFGCYTKLPEKATGFTTNEIKSNFVGTAKVGDTLICKASVLHAGRSTQVWDAVVYNNDKKIAFFRCTEFILYPKEKE